MNSRILELKTVREIQGMIDEGISIRYIAINTGLSWHTISNLDSRLPKNPKTCDAVEEFVKNKSYHIAKNKIKNSFNTSPSASGFLLECDGWGMFEINQIKRS